MNDEFPVIAGVLIIAVSVVMLIVAIVTILGV